MGLLRSILHFATLGIVDSNEEVIRKNTFCRFDNDLSYDDFQRLAVKVAKRYKRLCIEVRSYYVLGTVRSNSGISSWEFSLDFNDFGTVTGNYWRRYTENGDSSLPKSFANELRNEIITHRQRKSSFNN